MRLCFFNSTYNVFNVQGALQSPSRQNINTIWTLPHPNYPYLAIKWEHELATSGLQSISLHVRMLYEHRMTNIITVLNKLKYIGFILHLFC